MGREHWRTAPGASALVAAIRSEAAAQTYPTKPVTIILPYAAGGNTDVIARTLAHRLEQRLGQNFIVETAARCCLRHRRVLRGARHARRLHDPDRHLDHHGDQRHRLQASALRSDQGPDPDRAGRRRAVPAGGQPGAAGAIARRACNVRKIEAGRAHLRLERRRRRRAPVRRAAHQHARDQDGARPLQGPFAGAQRCRRRPRRPDVRGFRDRAAAGAGRQAARARRLDRASASARRPRFRRWPKSACRASTRRRGR